MGLTVSISCLIVFEQFVVENVVLPIVLCVEKLMATMCQFGEFLIKMNCVLGDGCAKRHGRTDEIHL